jgi:TonB family protein
MLTHVHAAADTEQVRRDVAQSLLRHTIYIRHAYSNTYLHFDESGAILNGVRTGYWSEVAGIYPTRVEILPSALLHIEADRMAIAFNQHKGKWEENRRSTASVVIEVQFSAADLTTNQVQHTLDLIFTHNLQDFSSELPYWQPCLTGVFVKDPAQHDRVFCFGRNVTPDMTSHAPVQASAPRAIGAIVPPRPLDAPQPHYTDVAREATFNGSTVLWLIVDERGRPAEIYVASPVGYGLDDKAVNALASWRFRPAESNGHPVRVQMTVEINFKMPLPQHRRVPHMR